MCDGQEHFQKLIADGRTPVSKSGGGSSGAGPQMGRRQGLRGGAALAPPEGLTEVVGSQARGWAHLGLRLWFFDDANRVDGWSRGDGSLTA